MQVLSDALAAAERVSGENHPRVALVLLELGRLYACTARVSYAEGLYRYKRIYCCCVDPRTHSSWRIEQKLSCHYVCNKLQSNCCRNLEVLNISTSPTGRRPSGCGWTGIRMKRCSCRCTQAQLRCCAGATPSC